MLLRKAAVHLPGNVGWMMTVEELRGDDSRGTKLEMVPKHLNPYCFFLFNLTIFMKNNHLMFLKCQFCLDGGSCCGFWWTYLQDKDR